MDLPKNVKLWGFNGSVPGPTIEVVQGDTVRIIVKNELPEPTSIHWHGLEVPNDPRMPSGHSILTDGGSSDAYLAAILEELSRTPGLAWDYIRFTNILCDSPFAAAPARHAAMEIPDVSESEREREQVSESE